MMRILIPDIWVNRAYIHDLTMGLRNLGHEVEVDSEAFWAGPGRHDILLWLWPEGFFRHSLGGKLRLLTDHLKQDFFQQLEAWQNAAPTVGILHNWMPRHRKGNAGRHWIDLYQTLVQKSHGVIHLGDVSLEQWGARFDLGERQPLTLKVSHGLNEQLKAYQEHHNIEALQPSRRPRIFVPGDLRTDNEVTMVLKTVEAMSSEAVDWVIVGGDTYGRRGQKNFWRLRKLNRQVNVRCFQRRINDFELIAELLAADIVISPRMRGLNSGIPYLAATFGKPVLMPDTGNLKDQVDEVAGTLFEPALNGVNLAERLRAILNTGTAPPKITKVPSWHQIATDITHFIKTVSDVYSN